MRVQANLVAGTPAVTTFRKEKSLFTAQMLIPSMAQAVRMLNPRTMLRNPMNRDRKSVV